jgi:hypothetical protein
VQADKINLTLITLLIEYGADFADWRAFAKHDRTVTIRIQNAIQKGLTRRVQRMSASTTSESKVQLQWD